MIYISRWQRYAFLYMCTNSLKIFSFDYVSHIFTYVIWRCLSLSILIHFYVKIGFVEYCTAFLVLKK